MRNPPVARVQFGEEANGVDSVAHVGKRGGLGNEKLAGNRADFVLAS